MRLVSATTFLLLLSSPGFSQTVTGTISGSIQDPSGAPVPAADIRLINNATAATISVVTSNRGDFVLSGIPPAGYKLIAAKTGFRSSEQDGIELTAGERRSLGSITLELGTVQETVLVTAQSVAVQTVSAERSGLITNKQMTDLMLIGRDYLGLLQTLPGAIDLSSHESPAGTNFNVSMQGNRPGTNNLTIDGAANLNSGSGTGTWLSPSVDAIAEVKVLMNNYQAEYGRNSGVSVNVITKGGSRQFHGSGYYFKRNEFFNANNYFNNERGIVRPRYRYDFGGFTASGPITIPGKFNTSRDKLFFFFAQELLPQSFPNAQNTLTVPTAAERRGDFSQTISGGRVVVLRDPTTGAVIPDSIIPPSRVNPNLQKLLGVFPLPNYFDRTGATNYITVDTYSQPRYETLFRIDYRINSSHGLYFRGITDSQNQTGGYGVPAGNSNWPLLPSTYQNPNKGALISLTDTFSPTLVHEFSFAITRGLENVVPLSQTAVDRVSRSALGINLPEFHPEINTLSLIPNASFGGVPNAAAISFESRYPFAGVDNKWDMSDSVTKVKGSHTMKAGLYAERTQRWAKRASTFNGAFDFSRNANNPLDTGWSYANALLGVYNTYSESNYRPQGFERYWNFEWYLQDTWKITRKLTLDYGMRFAIVQPSYTKDGKASSFNPAFFDPSKAAVLVQPVIVNGARVGRNPLTGATLPSPFIGSIAGGDPLNGIVAVNANPNYPRALFDNRGPQLGPRFGFAYDPFGDGKSAIRGGFGISYNRDAVSLVLPFTENPPFSLTPTSYWGFVNDLLTAGQARFPSPVNSIARSGEVPNVMSFSLGVQRDIGFSTLIDIAYAGTLGRHLQQSYNLNGLPPGIDFLPSSQDPTIPGRPLPQDFLRPYPGLGNLPYITYDATSNYNSLQVQAHRRFVKGFIINGVWTYSKTMSTSDSGAVSKYLNERARYYGPAAFDRTHVVNVNWIYDIPKMSKLWANPFSRLVLDDWQFTGITSFISGAPLGVNLTTTDGADITGSPTETPRPNQIASAVIPKSQRAEAAYFNTAAFARPAVGTVGNAAKVVLRGPGINNFDLALYKNLILKERFRFQLRWETYNAFNHTQFNGVDTTALFNPAGLQTNARFGKLISAGNPRRMQLALKIVF